MHRVLEFIDRHLDEQLELDMLAKVANFSLFHFHRLFTAWFGETVGDYVRRWRLETAAMRLIGQPRLPVTHVALSVGFGSTEAFARAFKTRFGFTPSAWRRAQGSKRDQLKSNSCVMTPRVEVPKDFKGAGDHQMKVIPGRQVCGGAVQG